MAERVRASVAACSDDIPITASVGVAMTRRRLAPEDLDAVLGKADQALYAAKTQSRNRVVTAAS